jgi:DNA-binding LacI/PurR family transcriptional regulator
MKVIAKKAGISRPAVSQILNNKPTMASEATKEKVLRIARELNYHPNFFAQSLKKGTTGMIGVASGVKMLWGFESPYIIDAYMGIGDFFQYKDYKFIYHHFHTDPEHDQTLELARTACVDGLIFIIMAALVEGFMQNQARILTELGVPFVVIHSLDTDYRYNAVGLDSEAAGYLAAKHLLDHGYVKEGRIGCVHNQEQSRHEALIYNGYKKALREAGMPVAAAHDHSCKGSSAEAGYEVARRLLDKPGKLARAYFAMDDAVANGMLERFQEEGVQVPDEVALVGFGDTVDQRLIRTSLTTVKQPGREKGQKAAELLYSQLNGNKEKHKPQFILMQPELVIRRSCGCSSH